MHGDLVAARSPLGGEDLAGVHEADVDPQVHLGEHLREAVVVVGEGGGRDAVEQAGLGEHEGAVAERHHVPGLAAVVRTQSISAWFWRSVSMLPRALGTTRMSIGGALANEWSGVMLEPLERGHGLAVRRDREDLDARLRVEARVMEHVVRRRQLGVVDAVDHQEAGAQRPVPRQVGRGSGLARDRAVPVGSGSGRRAPAWGSRRRRGRGRGGSGAQARPLPCLGSSARQPPPSRMRPRAGRQRTTTRLVGSWRLLLREGGPPDGVLADSKNPARRQAAAGVE